MRNVKELMLKRLENAVEEENAVEVVEVAEDVVKEASEQIGESDFLQMVLQEVNNKTLNITGDFNLNLLKQVQEFARNLYFYEADEHPTIKINISSDGGNVNILFGIISILEELKSMWGCEVTTSVKGWASSCGFLLWIYGNKREMSPFDEVMLHQISYGINHNLAGHQEELQRSKKIQKKIDDLITSHSPLTQRQLNKFYKNGDTFLDYEDCLRLRLITIEEENEDEGNEEEAK